MACALDLDSFAEDFRAGWLQKGVAMGVTRIGVHAGPAIVGNFGSGRFFEYAAYGDTINIASRLEGANKRFGTRICVSAAIVERIPGFKGRPVGDLVLRGRAGALRSFEALTGQAHAHAATPAYCKAFAQLERGDAGAMAAFAALVGLRTEDHLVNFHLRRLLAGEKGTRIDMQQGETWTNAGVLTPG